MNTQNAALLHVIRNVDKAYLSTKIVHKRSFDRILNEVEDYLSSSDHFINLSRVPFPASIYRRLKSLMGISNNAYQQIFAHTWRAVTMKKESDLMDKAYSEKLILILKIYIHGTQVFGEVKKLNHWLDRFNPVLGSKPSAFLDTVTGCQEIDDMLGRIEHGILA